MSFNYLEMIWLDIYYTAYKFFINFKPPEKIPENQTYRLNTNPKTSPDMLYVDQFSFFIAASFFASVGNIACLIIDNFALLSFPWFIAVGLAAGASLLWAWHNDRHVKEFKKRDKLEWRKRKLIYLRSTLIIIVIIIVTFVSFLDVIDRLNEQRPPRWPANIQQLK